MPRIRQMNNEYVKSLIAQHGSNFAFVINFSAGKDSMRSLGYIVANFPEAKKYVVMADTGFEHVKPVSAVEWGHKLTAIYGLKLDVVEAIWEDGSRKTYLEMVEKRGKFPAPGMRQCTSDLKRNPIQKYIRALPERFIISVEGIRGQESSDREKQLRWELNEELSVKERRTKTGRVFQQARTVYRWLPIHAETLDDVLLWHWCSNVPLHPVYVPEYHCDGTTGGYLKRFSCRVCIFSTDRDIRAIYVHDREAFDLIHALEVKMNFTMKGGKKKKSLFDIIGQDVILDEPEPQYEIPCLAA